MAETGIITPGVTLTTQATIDHAQVRWGAAMTLRQQRELAYSILTDAYHATQCAKRRREIGDLLDEACDALAAAEWSLFETAAPDHSAIAWKLEHLRDVSRGSTIEPHHFDALLADYRRLSDAP